MGDMGTDWFDLWGGGYKYRAVRGVYIVKNEAGGIGGEPVI